MIQSVRIIRRLHEEGTCNLGVEGQEGGRLRRKGIFREGMGKGQANTRAHTANNGGIQSETLQAREDEAGEGGRVTGACLPHRKL